MADEAFQAARDQVDFKPYDNDGNGYVCIFFFLHFVLLNAYRLMPSWWSMQDVLQTRLGLEVIFGVSSGCCRKSVKRMVRLFLI